MILRLFLNFFVVFRNVSWNRDVPADKLSFTMRREIDKHKEETELIAQLRKVFDFFCFDFYKC